MNYFQLVVIFYTAFGGSANAGIFTQEFRGAKLCEEMRHTIEQRFQKFNETNEAVIIVSQCFRIKE